MNTTLKRSRQFFQALFAKMEPKDHAVVEQYLDETEKELFYRMAPAVQKHCVNVAETVSGMDGGRPDLNRRLLIKAALLHDLGKSGGDFTLLDRVWYVLVKKISPRLALKLAKPGKGRFLARLRNAFYIHLNHAEMGASLLRNSGLKGELVYLVRNHHNDGLASGSPELELLIQADELN